jgi:hypothetical protein
MSTPPDHPMASALQVGGIVGYRLRSSQYPTNPQKIWRGKVFSITLNTTKTFGIVGVESVESGYEGCTEDVW